MSSTRQGLFISDDFGSSWSGVALDPSLGIIYSMMERSNGTIVAITTSGFIASSDKGYTWTMLYEVYGLNYYACSKVIESPRDYSLYYGADSSFFRSIDDGKTWTKVWKGDIIDCYAVDDSGWIYLGGRNLGLLKSTDNGFTFPKYSIGYSLADKTIGKILTNHFGGMYLKLFGGNSWIIYYERGIVSEVKDGSNNPMLGITNAGDLIFKADESIGVFHRSTRQSSFPSHPSFVKDQFAQEAVCFGDTWIVSFNSKGLHRSTDGGGTWSDINKGLGVQTCLSLFINDRKNIYVGTFGFAFWGGLYSSSDTGKTWDNLNPLNYDASIIDIDQLKNGNLIATGTYGSFIYNYSGKVWSHPSSIASAYSQYVSRNGTIYLGSGYNDGIYVSTDNGTTWTLSNTGLNNFIFFAFGESRTGRVFAASWPTGTYFTDDQGRNWNRVTDDPIFYERVYDYAYKNDTVFAGTTSGLYCSLDNGLHWKQLSQPWWLINKLLVAPNGEILASVSDEGIYVTANNGLDWKPFNNGLTNINVRDITFDNTYRLYTATDTGVFINDDYSYVANNNVQCISLEQNYPNPFNLETRLSFDVKINAHLSLCVFNVLGQEISTLIDNYYSKGHHEYTWYAWNIPTGTYFLRFQAGSSSKTLKAILIK